ncbi:MAG: deoxyribose-phosphate aldolase [Nitrospira sp.]|nr:deoxyribose-phosphate aldolase [Nitrospira sp.]
MSRWNLPDLLDHTVLRPDATKDDVLRLCQEARDNKFTVVFVPPCYIDEAVEAVADTAIHVGIPIGFPLGGHTTKTKVAEAVEAVARGARVLDMVLNLSRLKSGDHTVVRSDIAEVVKATPGVEHKVILETCYLTQEEKRTACHLVVEAGAEYVKTSTGFGPAGATVEDVRLMKDIVAGRVKVKASGGIRDWRTTLAMLEAGADRIGTSASLKILHEWRVA